MPLSTVTYLVRGAGGSSGRGWSCDVGKSSVCLPCIERSTLRTRFSSRAIRPRNARYTTAKLIQKTASKIRQGYQKFIVSPFDVRLLMWDNIRGLALCGGRRRLLQRFTCVCYRYVPSMPEMSVCCQGYRRANTKESILARKNGG